MAAQLFRNHTTLIWLALIVATVASWQVGTHSGSAEVSTTVVMTIAFLKVRFVGLWFMELKDAPLPLRLIFEGYVLLVGSTVILLYLVS